LEKDRREQALLSDRCPGAHSAVRSDQSSQFFFITFQQGHLYGNLIDILRNSTPVIALSIGMTLVIATGGVDLSVGAIMAIVSSVAALMMNPFVLGTQLQGLVNDPTYS
jgi:ribose/xylose/arabinose/galactoside ABC-type transport system permease subunit